MFRRLHDFGMARREVLEFGCGGGVITTQLAPPGRSRHGGRHLPLN